MAEMFDLDEGVISGNYKCCHYCENYRIWPHRRAGLFRDLGTGPACMNVSPLRFYLMGPRPVHPTDAACAHFGLHQKYR
ncbi:hypothetical protein HDR66_02885 [bacterium]|nr:hypothetical protein [bacterium]